MEMGLRDAVRCPCAVRILYPAPSQDSLTRQG